MKVTPLGVGDAFSALYYSTSLLLETDTTTLLVDCPHPIRKILRESTHGRVDVGDIDAVVLTHLHADHASGLEGYAYFCHFALHKRAKLICSPDVLAALWPQHLRAGMGCLLRDGVAHEMAMGDYFDVTLLPPGGALTVGDVHLRARSTVHHVPTCALRCAGPAGSIGYSADTAFDEDLIAWLAEEDVIIHETNLGAHTPYEKLCALDPALTARMRLVHYPDHFDVESSAIACLRQGEPFVVKRRQAAA